MKGDLPDVKGCKELLISNVKDEENHDIALNFAAQAHGVALGLRRKLNALRKRGLTDRHPSLKPWFLSVPSSLSYSQSSDSLETPDCVPPVQTSAVTNKPTSPPTPSSAKSLVLNLTCSSISLGELRSSVLQSLNGEDTNKHLSQNFWMASSDSLYTRGKAEGLLSTRASRMPAFFETNNVNLPQYA